MSKYEKRIVGPRLKEARRALNLTQSDVATRAGLHPMTITKAECMNVVTWRTAKRVGEVLGLDPTELVTSPE